MKTIALFCLALGLGVQAAQFPFPHKDAPKPPAPGPPGPPGPPPPPHKPDNAYDAFVEHFSEKRSGTDTYLQTTIASLYPNYTLVVTQDYRFNPFAYAAQHPDKVMIREMTEEIESLKQVVYIPRLRRRDGDGVLGEVDSFNGYRIAWGDHELVVIVASWREGYSTERQWHLLTEHKATSERFILDVAAFYSTIRNAILVFDQGYWHPDYELWRSVQKASWDDVILDEDFKHRLTGDYRSFFKSEKIYKDLGVPWKRGLIFLGPPGNGKTISLKAIMKDSGVAALYVKTLKSYSGDEAGIREVFTRARAEAPCVLVFEDLDSLITDENRSFFLNEVDGLEENDGLLLIGTTNHVERLDPALSSRPSRFDRKYTFADPKKTERRAYAVYWQDKLKQNKDIDFPDSLLDTVAEKTNKFSFAYLKEAFVSALVTLAIKEEEEKKPQGHDFPKTLLEQIRRLREQLDEDEGHEFGALSNNLGRQSKGGRGQDLPPLGGAEQAFFMGMGMGEEDRATSREKSLRDGRAGSGYIAMDEHRMRGERLVRIPSEL